jgi:Domain of unknown function (DUF4034)
MRLRILALALLLLIGVAADIALFQQTAITAPEPMLTIHDQPELALEDEPDSFGQQIQADLAAHRYLALDALAAVLRDPERRFRGGSSKILRLYEILGALKWQPDEKHCGSFVMDKAAFDERRLALEAWHEAAPDQPTAAIALTKLWGNAAWAERGCAFAEDVTETQWRAMRIDFAAASAHLAQVDFDQDPVAYEELIDIAIGSGSPREALDQFYQSAIKSFPSFYTYYAERATMLERKWYGSAAELHDYLDSLRAPERGEDGQIAYAFAAFRLLGDYTQPGLGVSEDVMPFAAIIDAYQAREQRFGLRQHDWRALFYFSLRIGRCFEAHQAIERMGNDWDSTIWRERKYFDADVAWYNANTPFRPVRHDGK